MKTKTLSIYSKLLSIILALFGVSSCSFQAEYGSPSAEYKIKGKIIDKETKKTISDIQIVFINQYNNDTLYTNAEGEFLLHKHIEGAENINIPLLIQDIDGEDNGEYSDLEKTIEIKVSDFVNGDGDWDDGTATKNLGTIELSPKKDNE